MGTLRGNFSGPRRSLPDFRLSIPGSCKAGRSFFRLVSESSEVEEPDESRPDPPVCLYVCVYIYIYIYIYIYTSIYLYVYMYTRVLLAQ
jgi:hypothetical protein